MTDIQNLMKLADAYAEAASGPCGGGDEYLGAREQLRIAIDAALASTPQAASFVPHVYSGSCPDETQPDARDPECAACRQLMAPQAAQAEPVAFVITDENINALQIESIRQLIQRAKRAHMTDIKLRINGQDEWLEADWIKHLRLASAPSPVAGWPLIRLGFGKVEVGEGRHEDDLALIFGREGTGTIGEATQPNREHKPGETLAVVTFQNVECVDVVIDKLNLIRKRVAAMAHGGQPGAHHE